jgi:hypothetical protein
MSPGCDDGESIEALRCRVAAVMVTLPSHYEQIFTDNLSTDGKIAESSKLAAFDF